LKTLEVKNEWGPAATREGISRIVRYLVTSDRFFGDSPGGAYRVAWELAKLAQGRGHQTTLVCGSTEADPSPGPVTIDGVRVVRYRFPRTSKANPLRWRNHRAAVRESLASELEHCWDVIHSHNLAGALEAFPVAPPTSRLLYTVHSPAVLEQHLNWNDGTVAGRMKLLFGMPVLARQERWVLGRAHRLHVLSEYTRAEIGRLHGKGIASKASRIPWWASVPSRRLEKREAREKLGWPQDLPVLFTVRRMVKRMGLDVVLDALEPLSRSHAFRCVLAGEGPQRQELAARASVGSLAGKVVLPGRLSEEQLEWAYRAADLFVLPTTALECFGLIVLEALAHGLPVLASDAGAIPELLNPILPEWLVEAANAAQLSAKLQAFLERRLVAPQAGELVGYVQERFGQVDLEKQYLEFIFGLREEQHTDGTASPLEPLS
jgi:glycosyltransferase involved in cell wall biosynthesis